MRRRDVSGHPGRVENTDREAARLDLFGLHLSALVCTTVYRNLSNRLTFPLSGHTRPDTVDLDALLALAEAAEFPSSAATEVVTASVAALRDSWSEVRREPLFPELVAHIDERLARHPLR